MQSPTGATSDFWRQKSNDLAGSVQSTPDIINIYVRELSLHEGFEEPMQFRQIRGV